MVIVVNSVIGGFGGVDLVWLVTSTAQLQVSDYSQLSNYTMLTYALLWCRADAWNISFTTLSVANT